MGKWSMKKGKNCHIIPAETSILNPATRIKFIIINLFPNRLPADFKLYHYANNSQDILTTLNTHSCTPSFFLERWEKMCLSYA